MALCMATRSPPIIIAIVGPPGIGKSSAAELLFAHIAGGSHLSPDDFIHVYRRERAAGASPGAARAAQWHGFNQTAKRVLSSRHTRALIVHFPYCSARQRAPLAELCPRVVWVAPLELAQVGPARSACFAAAAAAANNRPGRGDHTISAKFANKWEPPDGDVVWYPFFRAGAGCAECPPASGPFARHCCRCTAAAILAALKTHPLAAGLCRR